MSEHPTSAQILAAVHKVKVTTARSLRRNMPVDEAEFKGNFYSQEVMAMGQQEKPDADFLESIRFFDEKFKKETVN